MTDPFGLLPASVRANVEREEMVDNHIRKAQAIATALHDLDPNLELCFFGDRAEARYGIVPGRWHVRRTNKDTSDSYFPITTPDGGFREPDFGILEELRRRDLWRKGAMEATDPYAIRERERSERIRANEAERRKEEVAFNTRAAHRVAGEGGMKKRLWGKGGMKGVTGS